MGRVRKHWTDASTEAFLYRIGFDYVSQIQQTLDAEGISQAKFAEALGVSEGRVSQLLNRPGNLTLGKIIQYARALGKKVAIVAYDDNDPDNHNGPINSQIFSACWNAAGRPTDFFEMSDVITTSTATTGAENVTIRKGPARQTHYVATPDSEANIRELNQAYGVVLEHSGSAEICDRSRIYGGAQAANF